MERLLTFTIIGLSTGAVYGVAASGLVVTYTTTGIFNLAHGAFGMVAGFAYWQLRFGWGWPAPVAAMLVVGLAAAAGVGLERGVWRGLRHSDDSTRLVVSAGLLLALIGTATLVWAPGVPRPFPRAFGPRSIDLGPAAVTWHEITIMVVAVAVAAVLRVVLYRTRIGVAMRATVDDPELAGLAGLQSGTVAAGAWALGTALAAVAGILIAPNLALNATTLSLLIVNAYAAAMVGRLRSLPATFAGALVLGLAEAYAIGFLPRSAYWGTFRTALPMLLLVVALLVSPPPRLRTHADRLTRVRARVPTAPAGVVGGAVVIGASLAAVPLLSAGDALDAARMAALGIVALSLVPLTGFAGQVSLCQLSFAGIGALAMSSIGGGSSVWGVVAAAVIAGAVGAVISLPALRLEGLSLALATAAFAVALDRWVFTLPPFRLAGRDIDLFGSGSITVGRISVLGWSSDSPARQLVLLSVVLGVLVAAVVWLRTSRFGARLVALRDSEAACAVSGISIVRLKVTAFALSAAMAGLGGALYAGLLTSATADSFSFVNGLPLFLTVVVGGVAQASAGVFAGITLGLLSVAGRIAPQLDDLLLIAPGLVGIGLGRNPAGVVPMIADRLAPLRTARRVLVVTVVAEVAWWGVAAGGLVRGWVWLIVAVAGLRLATLVADPGGPWARSRVAGAAPATEEWEWAGLAVPWSEAQLRDLDDALGTQAVAALGPAGGVR